MGPGTGFPGGPLLQQQQPPQPQVMIQQQPPPHQQQGQQQQQQQQTSQRVFTGTVTKLHDNFGFVDEDVFFQTSVVKGQTPRVNVRKKYFRNIWLILFSPGEFKIMNVYKRIQWARKIIKSPAQKKLVK